MFNEKVLRDAILESCFLENRENHLNFTAFVHNGMVVLSAFEHMYSEDLLPSSISIDEQRLTEFFIRERGEDIYFYETAEELKGDLEWSTGDVDDEDTLKHFGLCDEDNMSFAMRCVLVEKYAKACELGDLSKVLFHIIRKVKELFF